MGVRVVNFRGKMETHGYLPPDGQGKKNATSTALKSVKFHTGPAFPGGH
jgi:hypothetical protein